ncbi:PhoX family protein [Aliikangiella marina]|uniref:PhoX family protein n=1 Tax=Aliikangiella marina TaxID=1712262 RepID=UPI00163D4D4D|nr:PhoX family phosphatase [Aliikangiella marina]
MSESRVNPYFIKMFLKDKEQPFSSILATRLSRRGFVKGLGIAAGAGLTVGCATLTSKEQAAFKFKEVPHGLDEFVTLPPGYDYQVVMRWGDPLFSEAAAFEPLAQTGEKQLKQFGFNNDYIGFLPLSNEQRQSTHGLLVVNHEHTKAKLMHPGATNDCDLTLEQTKVDIAAHGVSVLEVRKDAETWQVVKNSRFNRRITPETPMRMTGPAAGSKRLISKSSENGVDSRGTCANCAGGITPWGTVLTAEENVDQFFTGDIEQLAEKRNYQRMIFSGEPEKSWSRHFERWDLNKNPNEGNHMGWIVEIDPFDPNSVPKKRTALGRFKHEACNLFINRDGRVVAYMGDDEKFEYVYRFVSKRRFRNQSDSESATFNANLLEEGTLSAAKFDDAGRLTWLPLVFGEDGLGPENDFHSQADVVIEARRAADIVGATPMDRPEDIEVNPVSHKVYVMLTKNKSRKTDQLDGANPRALNRGGQIVELTAPGGDHTADIFEWDMLLLCGDPNTCVTNYHSETTPNGWLSCPDNCTFDNQGNLWAATDGAEDFGVADGLWAIQTEGEKRGYARRFLRVPIGAELCGPYFTPDNKTLFCAVQHPGGDGSFDKPDTRWPDFDVTLPPRPAVIAIYKKDGGVIGS